MSATHRSTRSSQRRKMVLPVTVVRNNGEKQLAHTLDLTEVSARLGGLCTLLESGEVIEIQRGAVKAKFQVFWMGAPGSAMEGQAGVRTMETGKGIWGINLPGDESSDMEPQAASQRKEMPPVRTNVPTPGEKRWHTRFECSGGASVKSSSSTFPVHAQVKDISQSGVYVETTAPMLVNTEVNIKMNVEGMAIETAGVVKTSYPMVGMGVSFINISAANQEKVNGIILGLRGKTSVAKSAEATLSNEPQDLPSAGATSVEMSALSLNNFSAKALTAAFRELAAGADRWKTKLNDLEIEEVRKAVEDLQIKLSPPIPDLVNFHSPEITRGMA